MDPVSIPYLGLVGFLVFALSMGSAALWGYDGIALGARGRASAGWLSLVLLALCLLIIAGMAWYK